MQPLKALKGADLVLYSVFRSLGAEVAILPIIDALWHYGIQNPQLGLNESDSSLYDYSGASREMKQYLNTGEW